jgi:tRNA nucleotidyltransferase (CCA-adding enzyme)
MEQVRRPSAALATWQATGAFASLIPALASISREDISVVDCLAQPSTPTRPGRRVARFAGLLASLDGKAAGQVMAALRSSRAEIQGVRLLVEGLHSFAPVAADRLAAGPPSDAEIRRWVARLGRLNVGAIMRLVSARWAADREIGIAAPEAAAVHSLYRRMLRSAFRDPIDLASLAIDGDDVRASGIPAGPTLGKILSALLDRVIENPSHNTRDWLLREAAVLDKRFRLDSDPSS